MATRKAIEVGENTLRVKPKEQTNNHSHSLKQLNRQNNISEKEFNSQIMHLDRERASVARELDKIKVYRTEIKAILGPSISNVDSNESDSNDRSIIPALNRMRSIIEEPQAEKAEKDSNRDSNVGSNTAGDAFHSIMKRMSIARNKPLVLRNEAEVVPEVRMGRKLSNAVRRPQVTGESSEVRRPSLIKDKGVGGGKQLSLKGVAALVRRTTLADAGVVGIRHLADVDDVETNVRGKKNPSKFGRRSSDNAAAAATVGRHNSISSQAPLGAAGGRQMSIIDMKRMSLVPRQSIIPEEADAMEISFPSITTKQENKKPRRKISDDMRDIQLKSIFREIGCKYTGQRAIERRDATDGASGSGSGGADVDGGGELKEKGRWRKNKTRKKEKDLLLPLFTVLSNIRLPHVVH